MSQFWAWALRPSSSKRGGDGEVQTSPGASLVETGGHGAALAPGTLPPNLHVEVTATRRDNDALTAALDLARRRWRHLAATLRHEGLTTTETTPHTPPTDPTALADGPQVQDAPPVRAQDAQDPQDPQEVAARVQAARRDVEQATARQEKFAPRWRRLAVALQDAGLVNRDVAHLMGVTEPRVSQLAPYDGTRTVPVRPAPESIPAAHAQAPTKTPTKTPAQALAAEREERTDNLDQVTARSRG